MEADNDRSLQDFGAILRNLRQRYGKSQAEIAQVLGVSVQMVSKLENGRSLPTAHTLKQLAHHFQVSVDALLGMDPPASGAMKRLPWVGRIAAGQPVFADERIEGYFAIPSHIPGDYILKVDGDSMEPLILKDSYVVVHASRAIPSGTVAAVFIDGDDAVVKRVYFERAGVLLRSENPRYPPQFIRLDRFTSDCGILGKVTMVFQEFKDRR